MKIDFKKIFKNPVTTAILTVIIIILFYFLNDNYKKSKAIYKENEQIHKDYALVEAREAEANKKVIVYQSELKKRDQRIITLKAVNDKTNFDLNKSQFTANLLSDQIIALNKGKHPLDSIQVVKYTEKCDSLAQIVPILSEQIDSAQAVTAGLIKEYDTKSDIQDSIIKIKDLTFSDLKSQSDRILTAYDKSVSSLKTAEKAVRKEKTKNKILIAAVAVLTGLIIIK